jgi:hypothetical protein
MVLKSWTLQYRCDCYFLPRTNQSMTSIESAIPSARDLNSLLSEITVTPPDSRPGTCQSGFFKGLILGLLIEAGGVAVAYGAIHMLRMAFR